LLTTVGGSGDMRGRFRVVYRGEYSKKTWGGREGNKYSREKRSSDKYFERRQKES